MTGHRSQALPRRVRTGLIAVIAMSLMALTTTLTPQAARAATLSATPATVSGATLAVTLPGPTSPLGVSPEVYYDDASGTYYLYTTANPPRMYTSRDGVSWTERPDAALPMGVDWSITRMGPNDYRMYFASIDPSLPATVSCSRQRKQLRYATSTDLVRWTTQPAILLDDVGCGVPHVMRIADGTYVLYYNTITTQHGVHLATSADGLAWTPRPGLLANTRDLVDPAPIPMPDGTYLMVSSNRGSNGSLQQLEILTSPDALSWTLRPTPLYQPIGARALDPSVEIVDGQVRVWFAYVPGMDDQQARLASSVLTLAAAPRKGQRCPTKGAKATSATGQALVCAKRAGRLVWLVRR